MSIEISNVSKVFGTQKALDEVSFSVKSGEVVGLLGPNGAGKSTLMKILTCFIPPTSGTASIDGHDVINDPLEAKKKTGYLPENNPLYYDMYITEYLYFVAGIHKINGNKQQIIEHILEITGLIPERRKKIGALSKGFKQRVGLAQAIIHNPDVLILDEPTSGLDPNQLAEIRNLITEIGKEKTILLSTHIMQEVEAVCNRAIIIDKGKVIADDSTKILVDAGSKTKALEIELDKNIEPGLFLAISDVENSVKTGKNLYLLTFATNKDIRAQVFKFAVDNNLTVLSMNMKEQNLEQVFRNMTKNNP